MSGPPQSNRKLVWQELLSPEEIVQCVANRKKPSKSQLVGTVSHPGVYRFIFPKATDGTSNHTPCYVGETGDLGDRMPDYFCAIRDKERRDEDENLIVDSEWKVQGAIQNAIRDSLVRCSLQLLAIGSSVNFLGAILNQTDFDKLFARRLLENWAILDSIREALYPLNCHVSQGTKDFRRMARAASQKAGALDGRED